MTTDEAAAHQQAQQRRPAHLQLSDPEARLAAFERQFGEYGGVNASIEVSTTFTGELYAAWAALWHGCPAKQPPMHPVLPGGHDPSSQPPMHPSPTGPRLAVLEADTLPQFFTGQKGPDAAHGGCYLCELLLHPWALTSPDWEWKQYYPESIENMAEVRLCKPACLTAHSRLSISHPSAPRPLLRRRALIQPHGALPGPTAGGVGGRRGRLLLRLG